MSIAVIIHLSYILFQISSGAHGVPLPPFNVMNPLLLLFTLAICVIILFTNKNLESKELAALIIMAGFQVILVIFELRAPIIYFFFSLINGSLLFYFLIKNYMLLSLKMRLYVLIHLLSFFEFISDFIFHDITIYVRFLFNMILMASCLIIFKPTSKNAFLAVSIGVAISLGIAVLLSFFSLPYFIISSTIYQIFGLQAETIPFIPEFVIFSLYLIILSVGFFSLIFSNKKIHLMVALTGFSFGLHYLILLRFAFLRETIIRSMKK